jgi:tripartite-type tricarboxylate transporter receptor subunit TctC
MPSSQTRFSYCLTDPKVLAEPDLQRIVNAAGMYVVGSRPDEFAAFLRKDYEYQGKLMDELGLKPK